LQALFNMTAYSESRRQFSPMSDIETEPLLRRDISPPPSLDEDAELLQNVRYDRDIKNDVLPENSTSGRNIGLASAYILVISRVIGSGVFAMPGTIIQGVGSPGLALTLWVIGALVAWAELAIAMEYGCMLPRSGGVKVYLEYTYRRPKFLASTLVAVQAVLLGFTATNCIVFAKYILFVSHTEPTDLTTKILASGLLLAITIVHGCFYKTGIWIQNFLGWIKVALITFMIVTGFFAVSLRSNKNQVRDVQVSKTAWRDLWTDSDWAWNSVSTAFFKIFYSYAGLSNVNNVLNEVKDPVRTIKTVGPAALVTACTMYLLINVAYLAVIPLESIKESRELIAALFFERVFGPGFGGVFLPIAVALSAAGNVMVVTFSLVSSTT
jgi:amino acid transporter